MFVVAPMAGICNSTFLLKLAPYGFDVLTLGGYNCDEKTIEAGKKIIQRGRKEFDIDIEDIQEYINKESKILKEKTNKTISANLRATSPDPLIEISKLKYLDIIEINAHCRQKEIIDLGCGQSLMNNLDFMEDFIKEVVSKKPESKKVSVKIRLNVANVDIMEVLEVCEESNIDYLHVDAMKPGHPNADLDLLKKITTNTNIDIIGNNSVKDLQSAQKMLDTGVRGISLARSVLNGELNFNFNELKINKII